MSRRRLLPLALSLLLAGGAHAQQAESSIPPSPSQQAALVAIDRKSVV